MYDTANDYSLSSRKNFGNTNRKNRAFKTHSQPNFYIYIGLLPSFGTPVNITKV